MKHCCLSALCKKDIICIGSGRNLGRPSDVLINCKSGHIHALVLPDKSIFSLLGGKDCIKIPWCDVDRIGEDVIWVCGSYDRKDGYCERDHRPNEECCD